MTIAYVSHMAGTLQSVGWNSLIYGTPGGPTLNDLWLSVGIASNVGSRTIGGGYAAYTNPASTNVNYAYETSQLTEPFNTFKARAGISIDAYTNGDARYFAYPMDGASSLEGAEKSIMYAFKLTSVKTGASPINAAVFSDASTVNGTEKEVQITTTAPNCAIIAIALSLNPISSASGDPSTFLSLTDFDAYNTSYADASFLADAGTEGTKNVRFETGNGGTWILAIALEPETDPGGGGGNGPMYYYQKNPISFGFGG